MKVAIIGSVGVPSKYGGFETLAHQLVENLGSIHQLTVYCSGFQYTKKPKQFKGADLVYIPLNANGIQSIPYDVVSIWKAYKKHDVLLILGVAGVFILPLIRLFSKIKIIVHIDGMEWKREKWKFYAKYYLKKSENMALRRADVIVADNKAILKNMGKEFWPKTKLIAYGGDHVRPIQLNRTLLSKLEIPFEKYAIAVCRIVPENNIRTIIKAFDEVGENLLFVGNWYDSDYGISIWQEFYQSKNIKLVNPIYNQEELDALRSNCEVYVHGHSAGGTNPSLVEAICLGLKIICFDVSFNRETLHGEGYFFKTKDELIELLQTKEYLDTNHQKLKGLAEDYYHWNKVAAAYDELFIGLNR